ncbi:hypothetical protein [Nocardia sp. NPDC058497]|uniref:hypothetical protein n=1 Tax=Nocardia sp. NPDC058497 TaxID=3346529 RepID=UPI00364DB7BC
MATIDYLYVLDSHPAEDSENPVRQHEVVIGGLAGRGAIAAARLGGEGVALSAMCGTGVHESPRRVGRLHLLRKDEVREFEEVPAGTA